MIGWLNGRIVDRPVPGKVVVDVHGVGYDVELSLPTFFKLEHAADAVGLHIHTVVREDALLLYGFAEKQERDLFRALIKVNGLGPKMAMSVLSSITPNEFIQCVLQRDSAMLTRLPGIGKKTAERLMVEMQDGVKGLAYSISVAEPSCRREQEEAIRALEALGYKRQEAVKAVEAVGEGTCEEMIRRALQLKVPSG